MEKLSDELRKYGYVFSWRKSALLYAAAFVVMISLGRFFRLGLAAQLMLCVAGFLLLPLFLRNVYRNRYYQRRFSDLNIYMEQFLYSFQKTGKILSTLEDLLLIFEDGDMRQTIRLARDHILHTYSESQIEGNALAMIEEEYPYDGLRTIHRFAVSAENLGGEYGESIMLLLEARRMYADRIYARQQAQKSKRREIFLSILTSLLLCSMIYVLSSRIGITISTHPLAQSVTTLVLIADLLIFYRADGKLTVGYAQEQAANEAELVKTYERIRRYDDRKLLDRIGKNLAIKRVGREIEKQFPNWLMEVSLLLQTENVAVAVQKSYGTAPAILKPALSRLVLDLKEFPESMEPYRRFLEEFRLPEVASSMKMLYSISSGAGGDAGMQIADIIRRNQILLDKAKKIEDEDKNAGMYALFLAPQITGGVKLIVDMVLLLLLYLQENMWR